MEGSGDWDWMTDRESELDWAQSDDENTEYNGDGTIT